MIEIDSAEVIDNLDLVIDVARRVRLHNIAISIDNVGAEWPSLMGLQHFPFVELKVDHQFVTGSADERLKQTVCRHIVELAQDHGARALAQGVEARADFLAAHAWASIWSRAICSASRWGSGSSPARACCRYRAPSQRHEPSAAAHWNVMSRHFEMSEPRPDEMMMQPRTFCALLSLAQTA